MALTDLTSRDAVLDAIEEFDEIGREAFLAKYGFEAAPSCFLEYTRVHYDALPIAAAAHRYQHGMPLVVERGSGGEAAAKGVLEGLEFRVIKTRVMREEAEWALEAGDEVTRAEISRRYGGALYGGIEPSARTPNVFVFTDLTAGADHGYTYDRFSGDEPGVFFYTGDGQVGDQDPDIGGNRSIARHFEQDRVLRLFEAVGGPPQAGGKLQRYLGAFRVDPKHSWRFETSPDKTGRLRKVVVFRLLRDD